MNKILIVSRDLQGLVKLLRKGLNDEYEAVNTEHTYGIPLRDVIANENPSLIIIDLAMPDMEGLATCLFLRSWTQAPTMLLSIFDADEGMVREFNPCPGDKLTAQFGISSLKKKIKDSLCQTLPPLPQHTLAQLPCIG